MNVKQTVPLLYVSDIERSRTFYCEGLGFELENRWDPDGKLAWCWLGNGGAALMLQQAEEGDLNGVRDGITLYFLCDDAHTVYTDITRRGTTASEPTVEFYGMKQVFVKDPDDYALCFESPVREN